MKRNVLKITLFTFCLGITTLLSAQIVYEVEAGLATISQSYLNDCVAGDIIELVTSGGVYTDSVTLMLNYPVTIRAKEGLAEKPIFDAQEKIFCRPTTAGINLQGIKFINCGYVVSTKALPEGPYFDFSVRINQCELHNGVKGKIYNSDSSPFPLDSIIITNSIFKGGIDRALYLKTTNGASQYGGYKYCKVENCLFTGTGKVAMLIQPSDAADPTKLFPEVFINHVTIDSCKTGMDVDAIPNAVIQNCIVSNGLDPTYDFSLTPGLYDGAIGGTLKNCIYDGEIALTNEFGASVAVNCDSATAIYTDAANGDYSLAEGSPGKNAATDGSDLGYSAELAAVSVFPTKSSFSFMVYPNPTAGTLYVTVGKDIQGVSSFEIFDVTGKMVSRMDNLNGRRDISVDISSVPNGLYIGILRSEGAANSFKILKK